jgi:hypothetical protein
MENGAWSMENVPEPVTFSFFIKVSPLPGLFRTLQRHCYQTVAPPGLEQTD